MSDDMSEFEGEFPQPQNTAVITLMAAVGTDGSVGYAIVDLVSGTMIVKDEGEDGRFLTRAEATDILAHFEVPAEEIESWFAQVASQMGVN